MLGQVWAFIKMILALWETIGMALGLIKKVRHEGKLKEIDEKTKTAGDKSKSLEERMKAGQEIEDQFNSHT